MKVLLRLFNTNEKAADNSRIPRPVMEKYLKSADYQLIIRDKISLGGRTHKDRGSELMDKYQAIGEDDPIMITENITHYITKVFFKDATDPICYAEIEVLDPNLYSGARRDNILNLIGDLKSGIKLPISIVIKAIWSSDEVCEDIIRLKGLDFTLNPSFPSAGIEKVYSVRPKSEPTISEKSYSASSSIKEKSFNADLVEIMDSEHVSGDLGLSDREYKLKYGIKSKGNEYVIEANHDDSNPVAESNNNQVESLGDAANLSTNDTGKTQGLEPINLTDKNFTYNSQTLTDRLALLKYDKYTLVRRLYTIFNKYYNSRTNWKDSEKYHLATILIQEFNFLIRNNLKYVRQGANLAARMGINILSDRDLSIAAYNLGIIYRKVLLADTAARFIPIAIYNKWLECLNIFYSRLVKVILGVDVALDRMFLLEDKFFSGYAENGVALDQQQDYHSIRDANGIVNGLQLLVEIDEEFGVPLNLQNKYCHDKRFSSEDIALEEVRLLASKYLDGTFVCKESTKYLGADGKPLYKVSYSDANPDHYAAIKGNVPKDEALEFFNNIVKKYYNE